MALVRQTNFLGGELDPKLWGRSDLGVYGRGTRRMRNFFPTHQGAAVSRPGSQFLGLAGGTVCRLIPFIVDESNSLVVEMSAGPGGGNFRFWRNGVLVRTPDGSAVLTVAHAYDYQFIYEVQFAQLGDVLTLTHKTYAPQELRRLTSDATTWSLTPVTFARLNPYFHDVPGQGVDVTLGPMVVVDGTHPLPPNDDATHTAREWIWLCTVVAQDLTTGALFETLPQQVTQYFNGFPITGTNPASNLPNNNVAVFPDRPVLLRRTTTTGIIGTPAGYTTWRPVAFNFYRGRGTLFGFVGQTLGRDFVDVGVDPDYTIQPPRGTDPFQVLDATGTVVGEDYPRACGFFQQRRAFSGGTKRPDTIEYSAVGDFYDFDPHPISVAGEALNLTLASLRREEIRSMATMQRHMLLTRSSVWSLGGFAGAPLDFDSQDARLESPIGATYLRPLIVDGSLLYAREKGFGVRALTYAPNRDGFENADLSLNAQHLFTGSSSSNLAPFALPGDYSLRGWAYQQDPWKLVWAVRNDGKLLSLTLDAANHVAAWAWHDTAGWFMDVVTIPEGSEDAVYLLTIRTIGGGTVTAVERLTSRVQLNKNTDDCCTDCSASYNGAPALALTAVAPHLAGRTDVYVTGVGNDPVGPLTVAVDGTVTLPKLPTANDKMQDDGTPDPAAVNVRLYIGLAYTPELELLDVAPGGARLQQKLVQEVALEVNGSRGLFAGQDFEHLKEWRQRTVKMAYGVPSDATDLIVITTTGSYDQHGRAAIRQAQPLPTTLVGVTRRLDGGDA